MNRSTEQALTSLIPRYNGPLPPELVELASSLLAQSRNKASGLKAEEEIGRTLKQSLNLPKIEPRPPCPPRIYSKLYRYLDSVLGSSKRARVSKSSTSTPTKALPNRPTPTKATSLTPYKTTQSRAPSSRKRGLQVPANRRIPPWIQPVTREFCRKLDSPAASPHVLAGVTSILTLPSPSSIEGQQAADDGEKDKIPALLAAVFFFVTTKLVGREINGREYWARRAQVMDALAAARASEDLGEMLRRRGSAVAVADVDVDVWAGWEAPVAADVDAWAVRIPAQGWLRADWFENMTLGSGLQAGARAGESLPDHELPLPLPREPGSDPSVPLLFPAGLGTMMQDRVDYLSEKKRAEYRVWKEGIMARIEEMGG
ncbi:MAG: hypothetical protein M1818_001776 [Claussenomyces sp. TS43310]|nr:MAG: hypothetical protein M1818_001776 [Claussenomyces sp. TS43310]